MGNHTVVEGPEDPEGLEDLRMDFQDAEGEVLEVGSNHQVHVRLAVLVVDLQAARQSGWELGSTETCYLYPGVGFDSHSHFCP